MQNFESRGFEHFLSSFLHVLGHAVLVVAEFIMKAQRGNSPFVLHDGVEVDVIFVARQYFAKGAHADEGSLILTHFFLEIGAESVDIRAAGEHGAAAAAFESVATNEFGMLVGEIAKSCQVKA